MFFNNGCYVRPFAFYLINMTHDGFFHDIGRRVFAYVSLILFAVGKAEDIIKGIIRDPGD